MDVVIFFFDWLVVNVLDGVNFFEFLCGEGVVWEVVVDLLGNVLEFGCIFVESCELILELFFGESEFLKDVKSWFVKYLVLWCYGLIE